MSGKITPPQLSRASASGAFPAVFGVTRYGATGDGTTDDTAAIQAAIDACEAAGGGIVWFPVGTYRITDTLTVMGADQTDGFDGGGVVLRGASQRGCKIEAEGGITAVNFGDGGSKMMCWMQDLELVGPGSGTADSRGIYWHGTGGSTDWSNVYVHGFETGLEFYDSTLQTFTNLNVRQCATGLKLDYQSDIYTFTGCRFDYNGTAIWFGHPAEAHLTGSQEENAITLLGCRISNNTVRAFFIDDYGAQAVRFLNCYFEANAKEGDIGVSGRTDPAGPKGVVFDGCYFDSPNNVAVGIDVYNQAFLSFANCKTAGASEYVIFLQVISSIETAHVEWGANMDVLASTAAVKWGGRNYNPVNTPTTFGKRQHFHISGAILSAAARTFSMAAGTGKVWDSWTRINSSTGATLAEMQLYDTGGVMRFGGIGSTPGYICATSISALPAASVNYRGALAFVPGGAGVADVIYWCRKNASDAYEWQALA